MKEGEADQRWVSYPLRPPTADVGRQVGAHYQQESDQDVEKDGEGKIIYTAKAALLDLKDPFKIIARIPYPILFPKAEYEINGDVNNVVFPTGVLIKDDDLYVYYGIADKYCGLATIKLDEIIGELLKCGND